MRGWRIAERQRKLKSCVKRRGDRGREVRGEGRMVFRIKKTRLRLPVFNCYINVI